MAGAASIGSRGTSELARHLGLPKLACSLLVRCGAVRNCLLREVVFYSQGKRHAYAYGKQVWLSERSGYCAPWPPHYHRCITDFAARKKRSAAADNARKRYAEAQAIAKKKCADWQPSSCLVADTDGTWRALGQLPLTWKHSRGIGSIGRTHS